MPLGAVTARRPRIADRHNLGPRFADGHNLGRNDLINALGAVDERLRRDNVRGEVYIFGGAAMVVGYHSRDATHDVNSIREPHGAVLHAAHAVSREQNLPQSWLNEQGSVWLPPGQKRVGAVAFEGRGIRVIRADPDVMLAMKVAAFRTSDHPDSSWLAEHLKLSDPDKIIELTERMLREPLNEDKRLRVRTMFPSVESELRAPKRGFEHEL